MKADRKSGGGSGEERQQSEASDAAVHALVEGTPFTFWIPVVARTRRHHYSVRFETPIRAWTEEQAIMKFEEEADDPVNFIGYPIFPNEEEEWTRDLKRAIRREE